MKSGLFPVAAALALLASAAAQDRAGAAGHWAFAKPERPAPPRLRDPSWARDPLDAFVLERLEAERLAPNPAADPRTLIRRLSLDLVGLPPTRDEVRAFVADPSEAAYEALVDRLLARPQFGENLARGWLDLVRFADTNGVHHDHYRELSAYRDWVIRAFADNLPYDRFVVDQIAGDLRPEAGDDAKIASGFHRLHRIIDVGTALPEESYTNNVVDRVTAVGTAFLGLTVHCAVCHDHKYDPISQREFFGLFAFFNNLDGAPETGGRHGTDFRRGLQPPYIEFPDPAQRAALEDLAPRIAAAQARIAALEAEPAEARRPDFDAELDAARKVRGRLIAERDAVVVEVPAAMVMKERGEPRPSFLLRRGDYQSPGPEVERHTPAFLPPLRPAGDLPTRLDFARWLVSPEHPLTARVAVNRIWQHLFGTGLVKTSEDFGTQGEAPSHPQLLDELAVSFVASGWDLKALVRRIVTSSTYRQASAAPTSRFRADPENRLLARGPRFRLDAEVIRDQILATSGLLQPTMFGRSVKVPQPPGLWEAVALPDSYPRVHVADPGDAIHRRSIYTFWKRSLPPPQMTILDAPAREACVARRERTNTPLQALLLLNETEYLRAAAHLARTSLASPMADAARLDAIFETVTARIPADAVRTELLALLDDLRASYRRAPDQARALLGEAGEGGAPLDRTAEQAAWTLVVSTIHNLDLTRNKD
jgi:hypothetical protein